MIGAELADAAVLRRIARRVEAILESARDRERQDQSLTLDIDARFRLEDVGALQFQLASAILEEVGGLEQDQIVGELLSLGISSVLTGAARAAGLSSEGSEYFSGSDREAVPPAGRQDTVSRAGDRSGILEGRTLN